jgi:novobiocin biosynthesis protein NovU/D-mycarose 3-C-methyltransferase
MRRSTCRACEGTRLEQFLDLGNMPLAGAFLENLEAVAEEQRYPLRVFVCADCGLVQILDVVDPRELYTEYSFSSSTVPPLVDHFRRYAEWLSEKFRPDTVVEFGCNDGILLEPLRGLGIRAIGVDLSENITAIARERGLEVVTGDFDVATAEALRKRLGPVDVVTGSNAFAHNDCPAFLLEAARRLLRPGGCLCLEVMYAGDLLEALQWDTLYHEHLTFYGLGSLMTLLGRHGFSIVHAERIPMHGGSLRVVATPEGGAPPSPSVADILRYESGIQLVDPQTWISFGRRVDRTIGITADIMGKLARGSRIWGYGAAGKATLWVNACAMNYLEAIADSSPLRAGRFMPGVHTPIRFPEELRASRPDYIFVSAWNYAEVIRAKEGWFEGIWVTPLPELRFF